MADRRRPHAAPPKTDIELSGVLLRALRAANNGWALSRSPRARLAKMRLIKSDQTSFGRAKPTQLGLLVLRKYGERTDRHE